MKNRLLNIIVAMLCMLCLYSCKKQFSLEESITILKDNDWTVTDSVRDMSEITNSLITYAEIHNVELNINVMLDYVCLTAPDRIQRDNPIVIFAEFNVFSSNEDAQMYYEFVINLYKEKEEWNHYYAINDNVVIDTNSSEAVSLIPLYFVFI